MNDLNFANMTHANYRHFAYRNYVDYMHGKLGRGNRRVIPACVVAFIRDRWPSPDGNYVGFQDSDNHDNDELAGVYSLYE